MVDLVEYLKFVSIYIQKRPQLATARAKSIFDINYKAMRKAGISNLIFDVDETLAGNLDPIPKKTQTLIAGLVKQGFKISLISNCTGHRMKYLKRWGANNGAYVEPSDSKPSKGAFLRILKTQHASASSSAMIGDRAGLDLWGAYLLGIKERILVKPYSEVFGGTKPLIIDRILRNLENSQIKSRYALSSIRKHSGQP